MKTRNVAYATQAIRPTTVSSGASHHRSVRSVFAAIAARGRARSAGGPTEVGPLSSSSRLRSLTVRCSMLTRANTTQCTCGQRVRSPRIGADPTAKIASATPPPRFRCTRYAAIQRTYAIGRQSCASSGIAKARTSHSGPSVHNFTVRSRQADVWPRLREQRPWPQSSMSAGRAAGEVPRRQAQRGRSERRVFVAERHRGGVRPDAEHRHRAPAPAGRTG